jgi:hypothetical protein
MESEIRRKLDDAAADEVPAVDLWRRMEPRVARRPRHRWLPNPVAALIVAGAVLLLLALSPITSVAQQFIERIGQIEFILRPATVKAPAATPVAVEYVGSTQPTPSPSAQAVIPSPTAAGTMEAEPWVPPEVSLDTAQAELGAHVLQATFLPDCLRFGWRDAGTTSAGVQYVYTMYECSDAGEDAPMALMLSQTHYPVDAPDTFGQWEIGEAIITDTVVRRLPGKYIQGAEIAIIPQDILAWEEDGFNLTIIVAGDSFTLAELQQIAAGLE